MYVPQSGVSFDYLENLENISRDMSGRHKEIFPEVPYQPLQTQYWRFAATNTINEDFRQ